MTTDNQPVRSALDRDSQPGISRPGWPRFTLRTALGAMLVVALACGWLSSVWRQSGNETQAATLQAGASAFQRASFRDGRLRGTSFSGNDATFQLAQFDGAELSGAKLTGSGAAFQAATFAQAKLAGATLTGCSSSYQGTSFDQADLSGAVLTGNDTAFQGASFGHAKLIGAKLAGRGMAFQGATIDGAQFQGADLMQFDGSTLAGCGFTTPPLYDAQTRFPPNFDPVAEGWQQAAE